jgi:hypothetical protein
MQRTEQINPIQFNVAEFQGNATEFVARIAVTVERHVPNRSAFSSPQRTPIFTPSEGRKRIYHFHHPEPVAGASYLTEVPSGEVERCTYDKS